MILDNNEDGTSKPWAEQIMRIEAVDDIARVAEMRVAEMNIDENDEWSNTRQKMEPLSTQWLNEALTTLTQFASKIMIQSITEIWG